MPAAGIPHIMLCPYNLLIFYNKHIGVVILIRFVWFTSSTFETSRKNTIRLWFRQYLLIYATKTITISARKKASKCYIIQNYNGLYVHADEWKQNKFQSWRKKFAKCEQSVNLIFNIGNRFTFYNNYILDTGPVRRTHCCAKQTN